MTRSHNIVGCEASGRDRLLDFSQVHGAMAWGGPRRRASLKPLFAFLAGAALAAAGVLFALSRITP